jgi:hypothetical protein
MFATSLIAVAAGGYALSSSAHAERARSQDPRTWDDGRGEVDESKVPDRIAMSTGDIEGGVVYIDPHKFYGELGARSDEGPVPVYNERDGGDQVGTYDLRTGDITIDLEHSSRRSRTSSGTRTRTTVLGADPVQGATGDSSPPTTATGDTEPPTTPTSDPGTSVPTPITDPGVTVAPADTAAAQP